VTTAFVKAGLVKAPPPLPSLPGSLSAPSPHNARFVDLSFAEIPTIAAFFGNSQRLFDYRNMLEWFAVA
jgi:hypothetical protein